MLKPYPDFEELPFAAYNNAPRRPADDGAKNHLEPHARDLLRQLASLDLLMRGSSGVDPTLDPTLDPTIIKATFANATALATAIAESQKQAVDVRFESSKTEPALLTKDDFAVLQARNTVVQVLAAPGKQCNRNRTRSRQQYQKPYGKTKAKARVKGRGSNAFLPCEGTGSFQGAPEAKGGVSGFTI